MISKFLENWKENPPSHLSVRYLSICVLIAIVYFVCGKLGLSFAVVHPSATPVWPDSGLMLAAFLLLGVRVWPAFLISAFLVNLATPAGIVNSLVIAAGNTAEVLLAAYLVTTYAGGLGFHSRPRLTFRFILLAALASTVVSASAGTTILSLTGSAHWAAYGRIWLAWWLGDAVSDLVVVPLVVVLVAASPSSWRPGRIIEFLLMAITLSLVAWTFSDPSEPLRFLCIPIIVRAAFRFGTTGAAVSVLLLAAFMIPGLLAVETSLLPGTRYSALLDVMWFVAVVSALALMVAAVVAERTRIDEDLRRARDELAGRVADVTKELAGTEVRLQVRETLLARAETVARTGSFEWNAASDHVIWSDELLNIHGRSREDIGDGIDELLAAVHREDREFVRALMRRTLAEGRPFRVLERIVGRDGKSRVLDCVGEPLYDATGTVSGVCGVCRDISDEQEFEKKLAESRDRFRMLIEGVKDYAIYLLDVDGNIASWNEGAERIMGYRAEEIIGRQVSLFYPEEAVPGAHADELLRTAGIDGSVEEEGWRIRKDGTRFWADVVITALREPDGGLRGFAKITRDLSERKASETALSELSGRFLEVQYEERRRIAR